jgi:transcriptional regulator with XRE-family HTH domain
MKTERAEEFGARLRAARIAAGHESAAEAARKCGRTRSGITRMERGEHMPSYPVLDELVTALGLDLAILFPGAKAKSVK